MSSATIACFLPVESLSTKYHHYDFVAIPLNINTVVSSVPVNMPGSTTYMVTLLFAARTNLYNVSDLFDAPEID